MIPISEKSVIPAFTHAFLPNHRVSLMQLVVLFPS